VEACSSCRAEEPPGAWSLISGFWSWLFGRREEEEPIFLDAEEGDTDTDTALRAVAGPAKLTG